jgi:dTDP-4-amino-4,6-dideoxygalactose transaminase|tara:strand:+ start:155 stop:1252 length:1098 start_codon:yes stop_codon:yes gene_type:complete
MKIKFVNLSRQYIEDQDKILSAINKVSIKGDFVLGESLKNFENKFSSFCNTKYSLGLNSGSDALFLYLKSLDLSKDDEIILPSLSFIATAWAAGNTGAKIVFCDVGNDMNIDANKIENLITKKTKVIIPVHLTGRVCNMNIIIKICKKYKIKLLEDSAQAFGSLYYNKFAGSFGDAAAFSLHPLKLLNVMGDGGVLTTNNERIYKSIKLLRNHGLKNKDSLVWGYNSRLDNIQAEIGNIKLNKIKKRIKVNQKYANIYNSQLSKNLITPEINSYEKPVFHRYIVHIEKNKRSNFQNYLFKNNIETTINYGIPLHLQKSSKYLGYKENSLPVSERLSKTMLSLPLYPELSELEVEYTIEKINRFFQ